MKEIIRVQNLTFTYDAGQPPVLKDINLVIRAGEYLAVLGPNGCGKTTLMRHFNGLLQPSLGDVLVNNLSTRMPKNLRAIRCHVGMVFQNTDNQIVGMSVEEDVAFGPGNLGLPPAEIRLRVDQALEQVGLSAFKTRPPHTLSGGQKQLLALAGILAMDPQVIVLDDPAASLDSVGHQLVLRLLNTLKNQEIGIIHVTHNLDDLAVADRVLVMEQGALTADSSPAEILTRVDWLKSLGLNPPKLVELIWQLNQKGENIHTNIFSVDDAAAEIYRLLHAARKQSQPTSAGDPWL
ncbi:MAG: ATP-binding cassette domain-containing protein [Peptococcaceae bacterium]|jgi:biotin transport system ATP-binding protein/energy-coupling factor transport system ATP-binding protein|nr:ATP-binding cassette domain-containing protein [Peptococcaceae bacterium]